MTQKQELSEQFYNNYSKLIDFDSKYQNNQTLNDILEQADDNFKNVSLKYAKDGNKYLDYLLEEEETKEQEQIEWEEKSKGQYDIEDYCGKPVRVYS